MLTNINCSPIEISILTSKLSDHFPLIFSSKQTKSSNKNEFFEKRDFSKPILDLFGHLLTHTDWNSVLTTDYTRGL
jgi:hypothetical protein